ncbi:hypothetical protein Tsubulata_051265, partial [Turnera subulata]
FLFLPSFFPAAAAQLPTSLSRFDDLLPDSPPSNRVNNGSRPDPFPLFLYSSSIFFSFFVFTLSPETNTSSLSPLAANTINISSPLRRCHLQHVARVTVF